MRDSRTLGVNPSTDASPTALMRMPGGMVLPAPGSAGRLAASPLIARAVSVSRPAVRGATRIALKSVPVVGRVAGRYVAGKPLGGQARTDATFWRRGHKLKPELEGATSGWAYRCGAERASLRFCLTAMAWSNVYAVAPVETMAVTYAGVGAAVALSLWTLRELVRTREHRRRYLMPLHRALRDTVKSPALRPEDWLRIPADFKDRPGVELRIDLPEQFTGHGGSAEKIKAIASAKLGLASDTVVQFHTAGNQPYVVFREPLKIPKKVTLKELTPYLEKALDTAPIIGIAAGDKPVSVDLKAESPHVLISGGTGSGKSILLRTILAQGLAKGGYGIIFDVKKISHMWAKNLPNVEYHRTAESIHARLLALREEVDARTSIVEQYADEEGNTEHVDVGYRVFVLAEEMNATINRLQDYWKEIKERGDPVTSPAVKALQDLLFMGRAINIHVLAVAQMASARSMGGGEARENYATRCLARYSTNGWRMLAPEIWPPPKKSRLAGRWQVVIAGAATETQVVYLTAREARALALSGKPTSARNAAYVPPPSRFEPTPDDLPPWERDLSQVSKVAAFASDLGNQPSTVEGQLSRLPPRIYSVSPAGQARDISPKSAPLLEMVEGQRLVGLRQAVIDAIAGGYAGRGLSIHSLRKHRERDAANFPQDVGPGIKKPGKERLYDAEELARYIRNIETDGPA